MKTILSTIIIIIALISLSCNSKDPVSASLNGDTKQKDGDLVPFLLHQNTPNPFNPSTTIEFVASQNMHLTLKVYTEDWLEVSTLFDSDVVLTSSPQSLAYSAHMVTYDARNTASGIYYYVLEGGGYKQIRAMRLIK